AADAVASFQDDVAFARTFLLEMKTRADAGEARADNHDVKMFRFRGGFHKRRLARKAAGKSTTNENARDRLSDRDVPGHSAVRTMITPPHQAPGRPSMARASALPAARTRQQGPASPKRSRSPWQAARRKTAPA